MNQFRALVLANSPPRRGYPSFTRQDALELIPVANKPILLHVLDALREATIQEVALVVHPLTGEEVRAAVGDGSAWRLNVEYVERRQLGLMDAVGAARPLLADHPFVVYPGNGMLLGGLDSICRRLESESLDALVPLPAHPRGAPAGAIGLLRALSDAAEDHDLNLPITGVYAFSPWIHAAAQEVEPSWRGAVELAPVIEKLLGRGRVARGWIPDDWWQFWGSAAELLEGNRVTLDAMRHTPTWKPAGDTRIEGRVVISASAHVESTTIRGPAIIGPGAHVSDAFVGPYTAIGAHAVLRGVEIENSIVMAAAELKDVEGRIAGSVIGESAIVDRDFGLPRVLELAVARDSTAMLG